VRLLHSAGAVRASFDDPNLVSCAGLPPVMRLAQSCDLHGIVGQRLHVPSHKGSNAADKVATIVAGMVAGADSIDDLDVVRHGGMAQLFGSVYAPSTVGEFLRAFTHGHVRQLQSVSRQFLVQLASRTSLLPGAGAVTFIDVDSLLRRVYGKKKHGVGFGHAKVGGYQVLLRGYHPLVATISTPDAAPVIAATQLRAGNAASARGAASLVAEAITTAQAVLAAQPQAVTGEQVVRADSAFYSRKVIGACRRAGGALFGHHPGRPEGPPQHRNHPSRRLGGDRIPAAGVGRRTTALRLPGAHCRDPLHRLRRHPR
jgi:Transposase DDE domain group 1